MSRSYWVWRLSQVRVRDHRRTVAGPSRPDRHPVALDAAERPATRAYPACSCPRWRLEVDGTEGWLHTPDGGRHELTSPNIRPERIGDELDRLQVDTTTPDRPETPSLPPSTDTPIDTQTDTTRDSDTPQ